MVPSPEVFRTLELAHWRSDTLAEKCAKAVYQAGYDYGGDPARWGNSCGARWDALLPVRIEDAFAPLGATERDEYFVRTTGWAGVDPLPADVVAAFEMMLVVGELDAAYDYACGAWHTHMTYKSINCNHNADFMRQRGRTLLMPNAVYVVNATVDSVTTVHSRYGALMRAAEESPFR